jgi:hypothetical protein
LAVVLFTVFMRQPGGLNPHAYGERQRLGGADPFLASDDEAGD